MTVGSQIAAIDFVSIQNKAQLLLGQGAGNFGYGQQVQSTDVFTGDIITKAQWDLLKYDIVNLLYHQNGEMPSIVSINTADLIKYGGSHPNTNYNTLLDLAITNKFKLASNQLVIANKGSKNTTSSWTTQARVTVTATFGNANLARYFFNSGGKIRIETSRTGGGVSVQNSAWTNFLNSTGIKSFGVDTDPLVNFYTLTDTYKTYFQGTLTTPYSANNYKLEAKTNVSNNSTGSATIVYLQVTLNDAYTPIAGLYLAGDVVNGTLEFFVSELKASGTSLPSAVGNFIITSPSYSISAVTVS
jgi:hypothetical protein